MLLSIPSKQRVNALLMSLFFFCLPMTGGALENSLMILAFIVFFCISGAFSSPISGSSVSSIRWLKQNHPILLIFIFAWAISSCASIIKIIIEGQLSTSQLIVQSTRQLLYLILTVFCFQLHRFMRHQELDLRYAYIPLTLGLLCLSIIYLLSHLFFPLADELDRFIAPPVSPHTRDVGHMLIASILALTVLWLQQNNRQIKSKLLLAGIIFSWSFLFWTGGRSAIACALGGSIVMFAMYAIWKKTALTNGALLLIGIIVAYGICETLKIYDWNGMTRLVQVYEHTVVEGGKADSSGRNLIWESATALIKAEPLLGNGAFAFHYVPNEHAVQPHNIFLQFLVEWGIIGSFFMFGIILYACIWALLQIPKRFEAEDVSFFIGGGVILALTTHGLTSGTYFETHSVVCITTAFAGFPFLFKPSKTQ